MTEYVLAVTLGLLFAFGTFLVLRRDVVRVVWGVVIMSQAANLYLITMGGVSSSDVAPIVTEKTVNSTDPLVQALVLTAIVIGFGTTAFALVLTYRVYEEHGTVDLDDIAGVSTRLGPEESQAIDHDYTADRRPNESAETRRFQTETGVTGSEAIATKREQPDGSNEKPSPPEFSPNLTGGAIDGDDVSNG